ncbi:beta-glucosidase [Corynebacterium sp. CCM 9203]|uniref:beta-glucosidase family protein n=1 Tax=Corynebacterium sp. CCM 9203 TaxID=3057615 RepID=UPI0035244A78
MRIIPHRLPTRTTAALLATTAVLLGTTPAVAQNSTGTAPVDCSPWLDPSVEPEERADRVIAEMTREEKSAVLTGMAAYLQGWGPEFAGRTYGVERLCLPPVKFTDGPAGIGNGASGVTQFPSHLNLGATFSPELAQKYAAAIATEARGKGANAVAGPAIDIARDPRWGRFFESPGEDPLLVGDLGAAEVTGTRSAGIMGVAKHLGAYTRENGRNTNASDVTVDERTLQEIYLKPFGRVADAGVSSVMCSYSQLNGTKNCNNSYLMNQVLRGQYGFNGFTVSDWYGQHNTVASANAGLDMQMPDSCFYSDHLWSTVDSGAVSDTRVNTMVHNVISEMFRSGIVDSPPTGTQDTVVTGPEHRALARDIAAKSLVLLRNDTVLTNSGEHPVLPVDDSVHTIGLIGSGAGRDALGSGGGSGHVIADDIVTPFEGLYSRALGTSTEVHYTDGNYLPTVRKLAANSDLVIVVMHRHITESVDNTDFRFGLHQRNIIRTALEANKRVVLVTNTGGPVDINGYGDNIPAVLAAFYPGQEYGDALADIIFGDVNPSGHLPVTWPLSQDQMPTTSSFGSGVFTEGTGVGYRGYQQQSITPRWWFGHGLSYTTFTTDDVHATGPNSVTATVTNTGNRHGTTVVQAYAVRDGIRELVGYSRVEIAPGETVDVDITIPDSALALWDPDTRQLVVPGGPVEIIVSESAGGDGPSTTLITTGSVFGAPVPDAPTWATIGNGDPAQENADRMACMNSASMAGFIGMASYFGMPQKEQAWTPVTDNP